MRHGLILAVVICLGTGAADEDRPWPDLLTTRPLDYLDERVKVPPCTIAAQRRPRESCVICKPAKGDPDGSRCEERYDKAGYEYRCGIRSDGSVGNDIWCRKRRPKK
jgi:hypothetical protein